MQQVTPAGQNIINDIASRYNLSGDAVMHMLVAVVLNVIIVALAPHTFSILPSEYIWFPIPFISSVVTMNYLTNTK